MSLIRFFLLTTLAFISYVTYGQKSGLINSSELLDNGIKLYKQGKYKDAVAVYKEISRSDTNYKKALHELAYTYYSDSNFEASKYYAEEGLKRFPEEAVNWYNLLANAYDDLGDHQKALDYYDRIIMENKNNADGYFNKGVTLYRLQKYEEAKTNLQQCIIVNPFYVSAHYFLGNIAMEEGRIPEAMMSYVTNLIMDPGNRYLTKSIQALSGITQMYDDVSKKAVRRKPSKTDDFEMLQEIIVSKIALDKQYKLRASLEDPIVRQLQVLSEKIEYNGTDKGFWMNFYAPFFSMLLTKDQFEPFVYHVFSKLNIKSIINYVSNNEKTLQKFKSFTDDYFIAIRSTQTLDFAKRDDVKAKYHYTNRLLGKGETREMGKDVVLVGPWEFYHINGKIKSKGNYNENQERIGIWEEFYDNSQLKSRTNYVKNNAEGNSQSWFDNGVLSSEGDYRSGELNGEWKYYYYNGLPSKIANYFSGKLNGTMKGYTSNGALSFTLSYKDDNENGEVVYYYNNGQVQTSTMYVNGEANGNFRKYFYGGQLNQEGSYEKNKKISLWKEYYKSGKLYSENTYVEDEMDGEQKQYYENGQLLNRTSYKKGKVEGREEDFDEDGKLFCDAYYEKGRLKDIKFYDKTGKVISSATSRRGDANLTFYDSYGNKTSEGYFTKEGLRSGKTVYYYPDGKLSVAAEYKEGYLNGKRIAYYKNGLLSEEGNYTNDFKDGYHATYHLSGKIDSEGWILEGKKQGEHISYNSLGNSIAKLNYLNDNEDGYVEYFHPSGKLDYEQRFEEGWLKEIIQYDTAGKVLSAIRLPQGNSDFEFKLFNGKSYIKAAYRNNRLHGEYKTFYTDGSVNSLQFYKWGLNDSIYRSYHLNGKIAIEGKYDFGNKNGTWKYYHENGKLQDSENFVDGQQEDKFVMYNEDGSLDKEGYYNNGELEGPYKIYGENNQLAVQLNYKNGKLISYTFEGKDGRLVPEVRLTNATGGVIAYYKNGNKSAEMNFDHNEQNGARKIYFTTGMIYIDGIRSLGYDHGIKKIFYTNGQLEKEEDYLYGSLHGIIKSFHPNGKIKSKETYYEGELHGTCEYYDVNGKVQVRNYYYGTLQSIN
jgi:antitoxin component YwqK of YwqJK toxin-antitoxin module/Flp pilus assembly protein TadD